MLLGLVRIVPEAVLLSNFLQCRQFLPLAGQVKDDPPFRSASIDFP